MSGRRGTTHSQTVHRIADPPCPPSPHPEPPLCRLAACYSYKGRSMRICRVDSSRGRTCLHSCVPGPARVLGTPGSAPLHDRYSRIASISVNRLCDVAISRPLSNLWGTGCNKSPRRRQRHAKTEDTAVRATQGRDNPRHTRIQLRC